MTLFCVKTSELRESAWRLARETGRQPATRDCVPHAKSRSQWQSLSTVKNAVSSLIYSLLVHTCLRGFAHIVISVLEWLASVQSIRAASDRVRAGKVTCSKCRSRKRQQYNASRLDAGFKSRRLASRTKATVGAHGVEGKKMRMLFQSNSVLKTQVAAQQEEIRSLANQLELSNQQTDLLAKKVSEALRVVAQAHKQLTIHRMANSTRCGDNAVVPIPPRTQQQPNANLWPQGQEQAAQAVGHLTMVEKHRTSPGFSLNRTPTVAPPAQHGSSISNNVSGHIVYSGARFACYPPGARFAYCPPVLTSVGGCASMAPVFTSKLRATAADQQLLGCTAQSVAASGTGTGSTDFSQVKKSAGPTCLVPSQGQRDNLSQVPDNLDCLSPVTNVEHLQGIPPTDGVAKSSRHDDHEISSSDDSYDIQLAMSWLL